MLCIYTFCSFMNYFHLGWIFICISMCFTFICALISSSIVDAKITSDFICSLQSSNWIILPLSDVVIWYGLFLLSWSLILQVWFIVRDDTRQEKTRWHLASISQSASDLFFRTSIWRTLYRWHSFLLELAVVADAAYLDEIWHCLAIPFLMYIYINKVHHSHYIIIVILCCYFLLVKVSSSLLCR